MNNEVTVNIKTKNKKNKQKSGKKDRSNLYYSLFSIFVGLILGMFLLALFGYSPFVLFTTLFRGNFSSWNAFSNLISTLIWMTFIGLAMVVSFKAGQFNIGISAQMVGGGLSGFLFATLIIESAGRWGVLVAIFLPIMVGMLIAYLIATLKTRCGVNEVVSSIMLNWVIYWFYRYFSNPLNFPSLYPGGEGASVTVPTDNSLRFSFAPDSPINIGLIILIVVLPTIWFLYKYTTWGVKQTILGESKGASIYAGIDYNKEIRSAFLLSGALAGLAGSCFYLGTNQNLPTLSSDLPTEAFNGIIIALIGFNNPMGAFGAAIFISLFENSKSYLNVYANQNIGTIITAIILWFMAFSNYVILTRPHQFIMDWIKKGEPDKVLVSGSFDDDNSTNNSNINEDLVGEEAKQENISKRETAKESSNNITNTFNKVSSYITMKFSNAKDGMKSFKNKKDENVNTNTEDIEDIKDEGGNK